MKTNPRQSHCVFRQRSQHVPVSCISDAAERQAENGDDKRSDDQADSGVESPNISNKEVKELPPSAPPAQKSDAATSTVMMDSSTGTSLPPSTASSPAPSKGWYSHQVAPLATQA